MKHCEAISVCCLLKGLKCHFLKGFKPRKFRETVFRKQERLLILKEEITEKVRTALKAYSVEAIYSIFIMGCWVYFSVQEILEKTYVTDSNCVSQSVISQSAIFKLFKVFIIQLCKLLLLHWQMLLNCSFLKNEIRVVQQMVKLAHLCT